MRFFVLVQLGFTVAAAGFLLFAVAFLAWALFGQQGEVRWRRLRMSFSGLLLFVASAIVGVWVFYLVNLPSTMEVVTPAFDRPLDWLSTLLLFVALASFFISAALAVRAIWNTPGRRARHWLAAVGCLVLFIVVSGISYELIYAVQVPAYERYVMIESKDWRTYVGDAAPDVTVTKLDGTQVRLSDLRGKTVLLNFFATWCGPCQIELPHLQELWNEFGNSEDFTMLIVAREENPETVAAFQADKGYSVPMAADPDRAAFNKFAEDGIPRTYLISRDGRIQYQSIGFADLPLYRREMTELRRLIQKEIKTVP